MSERACKTGTIQRDECMRIHSGWRKGRREVATRHVFQPQMLISTLLCTLKRLSNSCMHMRTDCTTREGSIDACMRRLGEATRETATRYVLARLSIYATSPSYFQTFHFHQSYRPHSLHKKSTTCEVGSVAFSPACHGGRSCQQ